MVEQEETHTYEVTFNVCTRYINSEVKSTEKLEEYGYSDQEWDELSLEEKDNLVDEWTYEWAMQEIEYWGEVS
jgi:hypothetical protein